MEMVIIFFMKLYFVITVLVMLAYAVRHTIFTYNRLYQPQKMYCQDVLSSDIPFVSVLIPMHNEELVAHGVLDALLRCDYPADARGNPAGVAARTHVPRGARAHGRPARAPGRFLAARARHRLPGARRRMRVFPGTTGCNSPGVGYSR